VQARLSYTLDSNLTAKTFFVPPDEAIDRYGIDQWSYGNLRRLLSRLIVDRSLSPQYMKRSFGYKLYVFENYDPVYVFASPDRLHYYYQDPSVEVLFDQSVSVPITDRTHAGYQGNTFTTHWIHFLSDAPSVAYQAGVYGD